MYTLCTSKCRARAARVIAGQGRFAEPGGGSRVVGHRLAAASAKMQRIVLNQTQRPRGGFLAHRVRVTGTPAAWALGPGPRCRRA